MSEYLAKRPFILCAFGCITASILGFNSKWALLFYIILISLWLIYNIIRKNSSVILVLIIIIICSVNIFNTALYTEHLNKLDSKTYSCQFIIKEITYEADQYYIADIEIINRNDLLKGSQVSAMLHNTEAGMGDILDAELTFERLKEDSYKANYFSKGIYLSAYAREEKLTEKQDVVLHYVSKIRDYIRNSLFEHTDYSESSTLCALLFGDKSYFSNKFYTAVSYSGVNHVMVVSGMHLSIIVALFSYFIDKCAYNPYVKAVLMVAVVVFIAALCGFTMSIMRAGITYILMALGLVIGRDNTPDNSLGAATVIILFMYPYAIMSLALQLSLLSTFGILCVALPVIRFINIRKIIKSKIILSIISAVLTTLSATLLTLPVCIYVFGYISKVAVITNLLIGLAVTVAVCLATVALIVNLVLPAAADILFTLCEGVTYYINNAILLLGSSEKSVQTLERYHSFTAVLIIILIFWFLLACKKRINMLKLTEKRKKILNEGGKKLKWR